MAFVHRLDGPVAWRRGPGGGASRGSRHSVALRMPPLIMRRQISDDFREGGRRSLSGPSFRGSSLPPLLARAGVDPLKVIFLDVDGVLAPRINCGQIVFQCVEALCTLCRVASCRIVLSSSWRHYGGKVQMLNELLALHGSMPLLDQTPSVRDAPPPVRDDASHYVRVSERSGLSLPSTLAALKVLGMEKDGDRNGDDPRRAIEASFVDDNYDTHVFSEVTHSYSRATFSPRSRMGEDWSHEPCTAQFAATRRAEIAAWLEEASVLGVTVEAWVVLDDDDLLQTGEHDGDPTVSRRMAARSAVSPRPASCAAAEGTKWPAPLDAEQIAAQDALWDLTF